MWRMSKDKRPNPLRNYDATDRELIAVLRQNRLDRLLESGALLGFTIRVREDFDPDSVRAVMMIEVAGKSTSQVIRRLRGIPELQKIHTTNGSWDL